MTTTIRDHVSSPLPHEFDYLPFPKFAGGPKPEKNSTVEMRRNAMLRESINHAGFWGFVALWVTAARNPQGVETPKVFTGHMGNCDSHNCLNRERGGYGAKPRNSKSSASLLS